MTIVMVAFGRNAGLGIFKGLEAVEKITEGSIGGFAVFRAITQKGELVTYKTQRGSSTTLITRGEITGGLPPIELQEARIAAIISSGLDRGEPLEIKVPGDPKIGLVSGHRHSGSLFPKSDKRVTEAVFDLMKKSMSASEAVNSIIDKYPQIDAGVVAVDVNGDVAYRSSERVRNRPDILEIKREDLEVDCKVAIILNEIYPKEAAIAAAAKCMQIMTGEREPDAEITIRAGLKVTLADEDSVLIDDNLEVQSIMATDATIFEGKRGGTVPNLNAKVLKGSQIIGYTISEPIFLFSDGVILDSLGKKEFKVPIKLYRNK